MNDLNWKEEQTNTVRDVIAEEIEKARLSHKFIPELKLEENIRSVQADEYDSATNKVDDIKTIPLVEVSAKVELTKLQAENDADLSAALLLIRRAANRIARCHDAIVFRGQPAPNTLPIDIHPTVTAVGGSTNFGLSKDAGGPAVDIKGDPKKLGSYGEGLIKGVALLQSWGWAEKAPWQGPDQAAIPNRLATKVA